MIWKDGVLKIERYWSPQFHPDESKSLEDWACLLYTSTTEESGTLPGNIDLSIKCSGFTSKDYVLYKQENGKSVKAGSATVLGGYLTCSTVSYTHLDVYKRQAKKMWKE